MGSLTLVPCALLSRGPGCGTQRCGWFGCEVREPPAASLWGRGGHRGFWDSGVLSEPHPETWALGFSPLTLGSGFFPSSRAKALVATLFRCHPFAPVGQKMNVLCHAPYSWGDLGDLLSPNLSQVLVLPHKPLPPLSQFNFPPHFGLALLQSLRQKGPTVV